MSYGGLTYGTGLRPRPVYQRRIVGVADDRFRHPFYIGMSPRGEKTFMLLPNDRSYLVKILLEGPSGSGKTVTTRNIVEEFFREWKRFGARWRHPIFYYEWKGNFLGIENANRRRRDKYLLQAIHGIPAGFGIPGDLIYTYAPAYLAPSKKEDVLHFLRRKWNVDDLWGIPWRQILDLAHLGTVLKVPAESMWAQELQPAFDKAAMTPDITLRDLIGVGGILEKVASKLTNPATKGAAENFVRRWRKNRYWFRNEDRLTKHLSDPFSFNTLTFVATTTKTYYNQLAFLVSLESLMATLQESPFVCQPVIILSDILNLIGEGKPFRNEIIDALTRLLAGQARSLAHGYIVILETQSLKAMPSALSDPKDYTVVFRFKWKSESPLLRTVSGFVGGCADMHDNFHNFHRRSVVIRPPLTGYVT